MKNTEDLFFQLALYQVEGIGPVLARQLIQHFGSAKEVMNARKHQLSRVPGIGPTLSKRFAQAGYYERAEREIKAMERLQITALTPEDDRYPSLLKACFDAPQLLFIRGEGWEHQLRTVSVVGTRSPTAYSLNETRHLIEGLQSTGVCIVSGLARGIDTRAHQTAVDLSIPTFAVLAHGLDRVYPYENKALAKQIEQNGCVISERLTGTLPDRDNFPSRNRIVAGLSMATVVMETGVKGGSMITANMAFDYSRDVFALPGRITEPSFQGCLHLISQQKAQVYTSVENLCTQLNLNQKNQAHTQTRLFMECDPRFEPVLSCLVSGPKTIDQLIAQLNQPGSKLSGILLEMEIEGWIHYLPGSRVERCA